MKLIKTIALFLVIAIVSATPTFALSVADGGSGTVLWTTDQSSTSDFRVEFQEDVSSGSTSAMLVTTGVATSAFVTVNASFLCEGQAEISIIEDVATATAGDSIVPMNVNRNSTRTSGHTFSSTPTAVDRTGTVSIGCFVIPGNSVLKKTWVLKPSSIYHIEITDQSAAANEINMVIEYKD